MIHIGNIIVVESISKLERNTLNIFNLIQKLNQKQIQFVSLKKNMTTSPSQESPFTND
ncbi:recombinase family protein [Enterococcus faecalis]|uniref:recombinase family protein n=1 Tax=Enterococcus faecalis TaxID=1351 RepID=UPI002DB691A4|nr:recombinase family protein [Enterococcus faecalis]MEB7428323.1 recombinase family protein [Enterococcus faecalis]